MTRATEALHDAGVSIWLDDLSRERLNSGNLASLIESHSVVGVTTNPAIFSAAIRNDRSYAEALATCASEGLSPADTLTRITTDDVRQACDLFAPVYERSGGVDGRVSIEVEPELAHDAERTIERAEQLWAIVDRPNAMIKIPATAEGLPAITATLAKGISVNVTLIFSLSRYREVLNAYFTGIEQARANGHDITRIQSVASFFISRFDTAVDPALDASDDASLQALSGSLAIANASVAYEIFEEQSSTERATFLTSVGMQPQRLLWASTGVKDPRLAATHYVTELVAANTVNTMPEATLQAASELDEVAPDRLATHLREAAINIAKLPAVGLDYREVSETLEREGLEKFDDAWNELVANVTEQLGAAR